MAHISQHPSKTETLFPDNIVGPQVNPSTTIKSSLTALQRLSEKGHTKFFGPFVDWMSRESTYLLEYHKEMELLRGKIKGIMHNVNDLPKHLQADPETIQEHFEHYQNVRAKRVFDYHLENEQHRVVNLDVTKPRARKEIKFGDLADGGKSFLEREYKHIDDAYFPVNANGVREFDPTKSPMYDNAGDPFTVGSHPYDDMKRLMKAAIDGKIQLKISTDKYGHIAGIVGYKEIAGSDKYVVVGTAGTFKTPGAVAAAEHSLARDAMDNGFVVEVSHNAATNSYHRAMGRDGLDWHKTDPTHGNGTGLKPEQITLMDNMDAWFKYHMYDEGNFTQRLREYSQTRNQAMSEIGELTSEQAKLIARNRAANRMLGYVHNPPEKTAFEHALRVAAPFYFAQNQAWRRAFRLMSEDPAAFERYLKANLMVSDYASQHQVNGVAMTNYPGSNLMGFGVGMLMAGGGLQFGLTGNLSSTRSMILEGFTGDNILNKLEGFLPAFGPVVVIPTKTIIGAASAMFMDPSDKRVKDDLMNVQRVLAGEFSYDKPIWTDFLPNTLLRNITEGVISGTNPMHDSGSMWGTSYASTRNMVAIQLAQNMYNDIASNLVKNGDGQRSSIEMRALRDNPATSAQFYSVVQNQFVRNFANYNELQHIANQANKTTAIMWAIKTMGSFSLPLSTTLEKSGLRWGDELIKYVNRWGATDGYSKFAKDHPDHTVEAVFMSNSPLGVIYPETDKALHFIDKHAALVTPEKYGSIMGYLIPRKGKNEAFSHQAFIAELGAGLRKRTSLLSTDPHQPGILQTISIASGNTWYYNTILRQADVLQGIDPDQPDQVQIDPGRVSVLQKETGMTFGQYGGSYSQRKLVQDWVKQQVKEYSAQINPIWGDYHQANYPASVAQNQYKKLLTFFSDPQYSQFETTMDSEQKQMLNQIHRLTQDYMTVTTTYNAYRKANQATSVLDQSWYNYLVNLANTNKRLAPIVNTLFKHLPMTGVENA